MDRHILIVADRYGKDVCAIEDFSLDLAYGSGENDFEVSFDGQRLQGKERIYLDGTGYGGIVDSIEYDTKERLPKYKGRTWQGILNSRIVQPPEDEPYLILNGEINDILRRLVSIVGLSSVFLVDDISTGIYVKHQFPRYIKCYDAILELLNAHNLKLTFKVQNSAVFIHAEEADVITSVDSDLMDFNIEQFKNRVNHLICLGQGELTERTVLHLYADNNGNISEYKSIYGIDEIVEVFDYSSAEDIDELRKYGIRRLQELIDEGKVDINVIKQGSWEVGDTIKATEINTGLVVESKIKKKIIKSENGYTEITFDVGEDN